MYVKLKVLLLHKIYVVMDTRRDVWVLEVWIELHVNMFVPHAHINRGRIFKMYVVTLLYAMSMLFVTKFSFSRACLHHSLITRAKHFAWSRKQSFLLNDIWSWNLIFICENFLLYDPQKEENKFIKFHRKYETENVSSLCESTEESLLRAILGSLNWKL